ncbi:hypothetical protein [Spirosoma sp.]|uniref:hypothetical protein n=1 Tax=Spirosoma sp. TaxID=1899569 RepID=UPI002602B5B0|nr:hypothetical protein [Spirosoma sp.]MCX6215606.1 hypothetical protein [Spirosoma sp.]
MELLTHLGPIEGNYRLYTEPWIIDQIQQIEKKLFTTETFHYNRDFAEFPFRRPFDYYYFGEHNRLFRRESDYQVLTTFLRAINSTSFFISAPAYAALYPLEMSVECPFSIYRDTPAYILEELMDSGPRPLQHPRSGVGFVTIPHVFMFDKTQQWAMLNDDGNQVVTIGISQPIKTQFEQAFNSLPLVSAGEALSIMERFHGGKVYDDYRSRFCALYENQV